MASTTQARFPCLAMVRYAMAAAVTLLAIAVIALVINAVLRSEDVRLSVNNGFIGADAGERRHQPAATQVTLKKAKATKLHVILIAKNPGGRTKIDCNDTTVSLFDLQPPYGLIGELELGNFTVPPQTAITLQKPLKDANASYIWDNYPGEVRFSVMVQVNANVTSFPLGKKTQTVAQSYTCQPVTVGLMDNEWIYASDQVDCRAHADDRMHGASS
ncbi:hypothetical protein C2845_PM05G07670 [Panicum miliaceum]|uniref:Late embryogenesis abundant protein LEA-2 subgroup domain-containing protein n=1 Tax=Panicum miliaceum TaxID=4540 RepID=A0A3L6SX49_PANMI|nr:hypothetical protein C2845_PM05G07670 [Panicum miliaceum]